MVSRTFWLAQAVHAAYVVSTPEDCITDNTDKILGHAMARGYSAVLVSRPSQHCQNMNNSAQKKRKHLRLGHSVYKWLLFPGLWFGISQNFDRIGHGRGE